MGVVLNEHQWAEQAIQARSLGKKPSETLCRVARYYIDECVGLDKKSIRNKLDLFLLQCDHTASVTKWSNMLDYAVDWAFKHEAILIDAITITKPELEVVDALPGRQLRRLAFVLICLAKYWNIANKQNDFWVNSKDNEIMALANINTSIRRQCAMYAELKKAGLIQFSRKVDNTNVRVCFAKDGETALAITDIRNLGYQYLKYHGEPYFECSNCGVTTKIDEPNRGRRQKYCKGCAVEIKTRQSVNAVMRKRLINNTKENNKRTYTVYMHASPNNKKYIGLTTTSLHQRWKNGVGYIDNQKFYADIKKFGWENIEHYKMYETSDEDMARDVESNLIQKYQSYRPKKGYNRLCGAVVHDYSLICQDDIIPVKVDGTGEPEC